MWRYPGIRYTGILVLEALEWTISKLYKLFDSQNFDADSTFLGRCVVGVPVHGLYGPVCISKMCILIMASRVGLASIT